MCPAKNLNCGVETKTQMTVTEMQIWENADKRGLQSQSALSPKISVKTATAPTVQGDFFPM
jgi:hypothetical protein